MIRFGSDENTRMQWTLIQNNVRERKLQDEKILFLLIYKFIYKCLLDFNNE